MNPKQIRALALTLLASILLLNFPQVISTAHPQENERPESWQTRLYGKGVKYETFACDKEDSEAVATFFKEHSLSSALPICHNDCPVIKCRPVIPFPPIAKAVKVTGTVSVHVLVDDKGKVIYARELSGHPLLWAAARRGACQTQFNGYSHLPRHRRQGVMHFTVDGYEFLGVPNTANQVR